MEIHAGCCEKAELRPQNDTGALARLARKAARLGGNAVWVLHVTHEDTVVTDCEGCCSATGFRAYGVACKCDESTLAWHKRHEEAAGKP